MVEVFKTNVSDGFSATLLLDALHADHLLYMANFDLEDRDRVLRVKCLVGEVDAPGVIALLHKHGFAAEILPDEVPRLSVNLLT
ncbi:MAG TPA: hypothetical protein VK658_23155 [Chryseolinea sp.]|nr:hypothetical protein [Chryseolinea sp.]